MAHHRCVAVDDLDLVGVGVDLAGGEHQVSVMA